MSGWANYSGREIGPVGGVGSGSGDRFWAFIKSMHLSCSPTATTQATLESNVEQELSK